MVARRVWMNCLACKEVFIPSDKDEDLCSECESEMRNGTTEILLGHNDCALVFRDGLIAEFYTTEREMDDTISDGEMIVLGLLIALRKDKELINKIVKKIADFDLELEERE